MNLELPFAAPEPSALDEHLSAMDRELDALFLDEVDGILRRLDAEREDRQDGVVL